MVSAEELTDQLKDVGLAHTDATVIADCIITRKSCSWMNTDPVNETVLRNLHELIMTRQYGIRIRIDPIHTRNKYVWEVKVVR